MNKVRSLEVKDNDDHASDETARKRSMLGGRGIAFLIISVVVMAAFTGRIGAVLNRQGTGGEQQQAYMLRPRRTTNRYSLAYKQSSGFFDDVAEADWLKLKERLRTTPECANQCEPAEPHVWYQDNWDPNFTCQHERRVGRWGDGGKWVCDPHRIAAAAAQGQRGCLVYSIGSNNDFSFEEAVLTEVIERCEVHTFDPTVGERPVGLPAHGKIQFHPWGLAAADSGSYKTLPTIQRELGHATREVDILKIDCEACEWETFEGWFDSGVKPPRQILIELHGGTNDVSPVPAHTFMKCLKANGYVIFHKEPNTLGCLGGCIEYAFLRLDGPVTHPVLRP